MHHNKTLCGGRNAFIEFFSIQTVFRIEYLGVIYDNAILDFNNKIKLIHSI
jgi:hypothetical protein